MNVSGDDSDDSDLDPRIQIELESLNTATDDINKLEIELEDANTNFRILLNESTRNLNILSKKLGACINKARPYHEAVAIARQAQLECQKAAVQYQRANEIHRAAKETVALAEQRFLSKQHDWQFDSAWQEMLNHATMKVMDAEAQKALSEQEHRKRATIFTDAEQNVQQLESQLKRAIVKSRPYFEEKEASERNLSDQKELVERLQKSVAQAKRDYASSLRSLESISEEIHCKRAKGPREPGVGAELAMVEVPTEVPRPHPPSTPSSSNTSTSLILNTIQGKEASDSGVLMLKHNQTPTSFIQNLNDTDIQEEKLSMRPVEGEAADTDWDEMSSAKLKEASPPMVLASDEKVEIRGQALQSVTDQEGSIPVSKDKVEMDSPCKVDANVGIMTS